MVLFKRYIHIGRAASVYNTRIGKAISSKAAMLYAGIGRQRRRMLQYTEVELRRMRAHGPTFSTDGDRPPPISEVAADFRYDVGRYSVYLFCFCFARRFLYGIYALCANIITFRKVAHCEVTPFFFFVPYNHRLLRSGGGGITPRLYADPPPLFPPHEGMAIAARIRAG